MKGQYVQSKDIYMLILLWHMLFLNLNVRNIPHARVADFIKEFDIRLTKYIVAIYTYNQKEQRKGQFC